MFSALGNLQLRTALSIIADVQDRPWYSLEVYTDFTADSFSFRIHQDVQGIESCYMENALHECLEPHRKLWF